MELLRLLAVVAALVALAGCGTTAAVSNPAFPVTIAQAQADLDRMAQDPRPVKRPLLILGGFGDPGIGGWVVGSELGKYLPENATILSVSFTFCHTFEACRQKVVEAVDEALPTNDPTQTVEVDVIGLSMGGLVGRYAAASTGQRRLRIHTLYTAASPHTGALRAERWPQLLEMQTDMTPGSEFYRALEAAEHTDGPWYELVPYVRLGDNVVGPQYAAPPGRIPWWIPGRPGDLGHVGTLNDPRILADVLRRLRGEQPWTVDPPAALPAM
jgi:pimeloyl-ACP methyl ester carboxylesterase